MIFSRKRGQGLSINVLIIAALGLVVFIILGMLFFNKTQAFSQGLEKCAAKFGGCDSETNCNSKNGQVIRNTDCERENKGVCCVTLATQQPKT
jgi:hypothetical protein